MPVHRLLTKCLRSLPFFTGFFVIAGPGDAQAAVVALKSLLCFCLLFLATSALLDVIMRPRELPRWLQKSKRVKAAPRKTSPSAGYYIQLVAAGFVMLSCLQILRLHVAELVFYGMLALILLKSLEKRAQYTARSVLRLPITLLFDIAAGLMSFQLLFPAPPPGVSRAAAAAVYALAAERAILLAAAFGLMGLAVATARHIEGIYHTYEREIEDINRRRKPAPPTTRRWRRLHTALLLLGPSLIGVGVARGLFQTQYQLGLLCILAAIPLLRSQHETEKSSVLPHNMVRQSSGLCLLFAAIMLLAGSM